MNTLTKLEKNVQISKYELSDDEFQWTNSYLADKLAHELEIFSEILDNDGIKVMTKPYQNQVEELIYRIPIFKPVPPFVVKKDDLSEKMQGRLVKFKRDSYPHEFAQVLKDSVGHLFENRNSYYYHRSVKQLLWVKII